MVIQTLKNLINHGAFTKPYRPAGELYDLWAGDYDNQPDNLSFYLDQTLFMQLMATVTVRGKTVADIGCGTGRHWPMLFQNRVADITGYDVSDGMLNRLKSKFPGAHTVKVAGGCLNGVAANTYDVIISTLTIAHIENIGEAVAEWCRVLKPGGDIIITDIHPKALAYVGKSAFPLRHIHGSVRSFIHDTEHIATLFGEHGCVIEQHVERALDNTLMHYYIKNDAMHMYQKLRGMPIMYGLHLKKM